MRLKVKCRRNATPQAYELKSKNLLNFYAKLVQLAIFGPGLLRFWGVYKVDILTLPKTVDWIVQNEHIKGMCLKMTHHVSWSKYPPEPP